MNTGQQISSDPHSRLPSMYTPAPSTFSQTVHQSPRGAECTASTASRSPSPYLASCTRDQFQRTSGSTSNTIASSPQEEMVRCPTRKETSDWTKKDYETQGCTSCVKSAKPALLSSPVHVGTSAPSLLLRSAKSTFSLWSCGSFSANMSST
jgi:hypothetical protein